jgi:hypothetical protein
MKLEAYCNRCGVSCGKQAIGESCSNNDGGRIISVADHAPATLAQLQSLGEYVNRIDIETVCTPVTGVTEFGVRYQDPAFGQTGALTYIYMLADGDSMAIVTTERRLKTNADPAWTGPDHKWEYPIFVRLFTDWNKKWPERRAFGQREMEEIEYPERMMHGGIGRGHRGARTKAREWVRDQMLQKVSSNG